MHTNLHAPYISLEGAISLLSADGIVALPTETVYGLFGRANSSRAIKRVYHIKNRPLDNPLICHVSSMQGIEQYATDIPSYVYTLVHAFCPGPLSFLLHIKPQSGLFPHIPNLSTIVFRIPQHDITLQVLSRVGVPLFGPSANTSTKISGVHPDMILRDLGEKIDGIYEGGISSIGVESTIIDCRDHTHITILRPGIIGKTELEQTIPALPVYETRNTDITTPGSKYTHYSPDCKITLEPLNMTDFSLPLIGCDEDVAYHPLHISLGSQNHPHRIAHNLYNSLYQLDINGYTHAYFSRRSYTYILSHSHSTFKAIANRISKMIINM